MSIFNKSPKLLVPHLNMEQKISKEIFLLKKKDNLSPRTNHSLSSDRNSHNKSPCKIRDRSFKPTEPVTIHSKIGCRCAVCQNKLNDTINTPELLLDSFFEEEKDNELARTPLFELEKSSVGKNLSQISVLKGSVLLNSDPDLIDKDFLFVLRRLLPSKNSLYCLRILIPDTVLFSNGEAKFLVYNGKDDFLKCVRQKEKLNPSEIKQFFLDRRTRKENQLLAIQESILLSLIGLNSPRRSIQNSQSKRTSMNRISLLGEDLNCEIVEGLDLKKVQETMKIKRFNDPNNSAIKEFAFVRYKDSIFWGGVEELEFDFLLDNVRILSEMDFLNLMTKRRIEKALNDVLYLQMFLKPKRGSDSLIRVKYIYEKEKHKELFTKSLNEICIMSNLRPPSEDKGPSTAEQESLQFEADLKKNNINEYSYYITYKIVHYIEAFSGIKIIKFIAEYLKDDFNNLWLMNCCHIRSFDINAMFTKDPDYILKKVNLIDQEQKKELINDLETFYEKSSKYRKKKIDKISDKFIQNYEKTKEQLGIDLNQKTPEDSFSDNVFKNLNPNNPFTLSHILKNSHKIALKRYILQNFPENLLKYDKESQETEARNLKLTNKSTIRPNLQKIKATDLTKSTNYTSFNRTGLSKFGLNYENKNKKQEKFLSLCHNGLKKTKNIDYNNLLGEMSNLRKDTDENKAMKVKNNFEIKKTKEKKKRFQMNNNFFKEKKEIETNAVELSKYALKNLSDTLPYLLYHKKK